MALPFPASMQKTATVKVATQTAASNVKKQAARSGSSTITGVLDTNATPQAIYDAYGIEMTRGAIWYSNAAADVSLLVKGNRLLIGSVEWGIEATAQVSDALSDLAHCHCPVKRIE